MNSSKKILPLAQLIYRQVARNASSDAYPVPPRYAKFLAKRARLEIPDDTPVHLKYSLMDKLMCQGTWLLTLVGTGMTLEVFYKIISGKKD